MDPDSNSLLYVRWVCVEGGVGTGGKLSKMKKILMTFGRERNRTQRGQMLNGSFQRSFWWVIKREPNEERCAATAPALCSLSAVGGWGAIEKIPALIREPGAPFAHCSTRHPQCCCVLHWVNDSSSPRPSERGWGKAGGGLRWVIQREMGF